MLRAFRWNLRILSYISLLVGAFLIYNTIAVSVVRRRTEIGILRALGTSSRGVLADLPRRSHHAGRHRLGSRNRPRTPARRRAARHDLRHRERPLHHQHARRDRAVARIDSGRALHRNRGRLLLRADPGARSRPRRPGRSDAPVGRRARNPAPHPPRSRHRRTAPPSSPRSSASSDRSTDGPSSAMPPRCSRSPPPPWSRPHSSPA